MHPSWYTLHNTDTIDTPALVIYPDRVKENIHLLKRMSKGLDWLRPHVKTHKLAEVTSLLLQEGIYKFKCATIAEAEMLAICGAKDVLLAYQPVGPKILRLRQLVQFYPATTFSCLIDNIQSAEAIAQAFVHSGKSINIFVDINVGMNRTGISPNEKALELYLACAAIEGITMVGLHAYDGHIRDTDFALREQKCDTAFQPVIILAEKIVSRGLPYPILVAGGSPTFPVHAQRQGVECSPGTFIFWDWGYHTILPEQNFLFAALVISRIISIIDAQTLCLDLGHKSIAAENPLPRVKFLNIPDAEPFSQSEEHMVVKVNDSSQYQVGDIWYGVPVHICPTCALYDYVQLAINHQVHTKWPVIARNRVIYV